MPTITYKTATITTRNPRRYYMTAVPPTNAGKAIMAKWLARFSVFGSRLAVRAFNRHQRREADKARRGETPDFRDNVADWINKATLMDLRDSITTRIRHSDTVTNARVMIFTVEEGVTLPGALTEIGATPAEARAWIRDNIQEEATP